MNQFKKIISVAFACKASIQTGENVLLSAN